MDNTLIGRLATLKHQAQGKNENYIKVSFSLLAEIIAALLGAKVKDEK